MAAFAYRAVDSSGNRVRGELVAPNPVALTRMLEERGLLVLEVDETVRPKEVRSTVFGFRARREVLEITRALASLLPAGMPLARALEAVSGLSTGRAFDAVADVRNRVASGEGVADAFSQHPDLFSPVYVGLVRAGEKGGDLNGAFERLSLQLEREEELRSQLLSASVYPMLLATLGGIAMLVLVLFVVPRFAELLEGTGAVLPRSTSIVLAVAAVIERIWPLFVLLPVLGGALLRWAHTTEEGRRASTGLQLRIPLVHHFVRYGLAAQFTRLSGTLLSGGAPLLTALDDTAESLTNPVLREETLRVRTRVREGSSLAQAIEEGTLFPDLAAQLVSVGEQSSRLPEFLLKAAQIFEEKTERALQRLVVVLEPAMIIFFGSIVAIVALALLQAIYGLNAEAF